MSYYEYPEVMYIGPWQEYKLGQKQQRDREAGGEQSLRNDLLRNELQKALQVRNKCKLS